MSDNTATGDTCAVPSVLASSAISVSLAFLVKARNPKLLPVLVTAGVTSIVCTVFSLFLCDRFLDYLKTPSQEALSLIAKQNELLSLVRHNRRLLEGAREESGRKYFACIVADESGRSCVELQDSYNTLRNKVDMYYKKEEKIIFEQDCLKAKVRFPNEDLLDSMLSHEKS